MNDLVHRTYPRLLTTGTLLILSLFFLGLTILILSDSNNYENTIFNIFLITLFSVTTAILLYHLFKTKTIYISKSQLIISNFFFPHKHSYDLAEINTIRQSKKTTTHYLPDSSLPIDKSDTYTISMFKTIIETTNKKQIIIKSIGKEEFNLLYKVFTKRKRAEGTVKKVKSRLFLYLIDNIGGLFLIIGLSFLSIGLLISLKS